MFDFAKPLPFGLGPRNWYYFVGGLIAVLALVLLVDVAVLQSARAWPEPVRSFFSWITDLGLAATTLYPALKVFLLLLGLAAIVHDRLPRFALIEMAQVTGFVFVGVGMASLVANLLKRTIGRGRPELFDSVGHLRFQGFFNDWTYESFPSGHATTIFAVAMVFGFLLPRWFPALLVVAVLVGLSRVVVGAHYPTDVIGGAVCGILVAYLVRSFFAWRRWVFVRGADGRIASRGFPATRRFARIWMR